MATHDSPAGTLSRNPEEMARILTSLQGQGKVFATTYGKEDRKLAAKLLFVDPGHHYIAVEAPEGEAQIADLLTRSRLSFTVDVAGWHIEFAAADPQRTTLAGKTAIRLVFPEAMFRQQRRTEPRVVVPLFAPLRCIADAQGVAPFEGKIVDIGRGGIGFLLYSSDITLEPGTVLKGCNIVRPGKEPVVVDLEVRYSAPVVLADGSHAHRSGCVFLNPTREVTDLIASFAPAG